MFVQFRTFLFALLIGVIISSCQSAPQRLPYLLVTSNPAGTTTPTPFQPDYNSQPRSAAPSPLPTSFDALAALATLGTPIVGLTPTPPTSVYAQSTMDAYISATPNFYGNVWEDFPPPRIYPASTQIPYPMGMLPQPKDQINILLLGSDIRPDTVSYRTDTIILLTINKDMGTISLTSIPRDLYVYIPGWTVRRINTAMNYGGYETLAMTLAYNFGVYPDHYLMVNFSNFVKIINSLGGIDVQVAKNFSDQRAGYGWYQVKQGTTHMDGDTALWYVRSRHTTNDIDRLRRAQEVIQAIGYRMLSFDVLKRAPALYEIYKDTVYTDLEVENISKLLPAANILTKTQNIRRYVIGYELAYDWTNPVTGAMVLIPDRYGIREMMREVLNSP